MAHHSKQGRVFVAATSQDQGKTTVSLGLMAALPKMGGQVAFMKPVGQRYVEVDGVRVDEDVALMRTIFPCACPLADMSPITVDRSFTREYIREPQREDLFRRIRESFERVAADQSAVIIEGTGHAGVGSCFDASNADVARLLDAKALIVSPGGIGKAIDEVMLNKALFNQQGVELLGVVLNKVLPQKLAEIREVVRHGLARLGVDLIGCIPYEPTLSSPTMLQVLEGLEGKVLNGQHRMDNEVKTVIVGAMTAHCALGHITPGCLLITPGDRDDLILAAITVSSTEPDTDRGLAGIVLTGGLLPDRAILSMVRRTEIPVIAVEGDSYQTTAAVHDLKVKIRPTDEAKIAAIPRLVEQHVDLERIVGSF